MSVVVSFEDFTPAARFDSIPWEEVEIWESATEDGSYTLIDTQALSPVDADPADPASRDFTTLNGTADNQWYTVRFVDGNGDYSEHTEPIQNVEDDTYAVAYATPEELARILRISSPSAAQTAALNRVLTAAALEIDIELDRPGIFSEPYPPIIVQVNLERAAELWKMQELQVGVLTGLDGAGMYVTQDTWKRYVPRLAGLKRGWGFA